MRLLDSGSLGQSQFDMLSSVAGELQHQYPNKTSPPLSRLPPSLQSAYMHPTRALSPQPLIHKSNQSHKSDKSPASSFIVLSQSQISETGHPAAPSPAEIKLARSAALYHLLNTASSIDHPLCVECADALQDAMNQQLDTVKAERQRYLTFEKEIMSNDSLEHPDLDKLQRQLESLTRDEETALKSLRDAEVEQEQLEAQLAELEREEAELQAQEEESVI